MLGRTLAALGVIAALFTTSAHAAVIQERGPLLSATNGIALGPDGNFWVAEEFNGSVARMTPGGTVLNRYSVGNNPTSVATGPGGRVWVSITGREQAGLVRRDLRARRRRTTGRPAWPAGRWRSSTAATTACTSRCRPAARARARHGRRRRHRCVGPRTSRGQFYDLEAASGKLFAPDFGGDAVRRIALGTPDGRGLARRRRAARTASPPTAPATSGSRCTTPAMSAASPATQNLGTVTDLTPTGGTLSEPVRHRRGQRRTHLRHRQGLAQHRPHQRRRQLPLLPDDG